MIPTLTLIVLVLAEPPPPPSPWRCEVCGRPVNLSVDLMPAHRDGSTGHKARLSRADWETLADGLRLSGPTMSGVRPVKPKPQPQPRRSDPRREV